MNSKHGSIDNSYQTFISRIMQYSGQGITRYSIKYNMEYLLEMLDRYKIQQLDRMHLGNQLTLVEFVRFFMKVIPHSSDENLYIVMALIELYGQICRITFSKNTIQFKDVTNFLCNKILEMGDAKVIEPRYIPLQHRYNCKYRMKEHITSPPYILGTQDIKTHKLAIESLVIDKTKHNSSICRYIKQYDSCAFSIEKRRLFTLDTLTDVIQIYNEDCQVVGEIKPACSKIKKDIVIICFAYSQKQQRIGAVLKNYSLNFWDLSDVEYEKSIATTSFSGSYQTNIWFLDYFDCWLTADKGGMLYIWDLTNNQPKRVIKCKYSSKVNEICQIPSLNLLAVVQDYIRKKQTNNEARISLYNFVEGQISFNIPLLSARMPHTIKFSTSYQALLTAGFQKKIKLFQINPKFIDATLKGQLTGHQYLITSFQLINKTSLVVSADDKGIIKTWDIRTFNCIQTINLSTKSIITKIIDMAIIGKIAIFGSKINFISFEDLSYLSKQINKSDSYYPLSVAYDSSQQQLITITQKDIRVIDIQNGKLKYINCQFQKSHQDVTYFKYIPSMKKAIIGNEKGDIDVYNITTGKLEERLPSHHNAITFIDYDQHNKLFITGSYDSNIHIIRKNQHQHYQVIRQIKNHFNKRQITHMRLSVYHSLIAVGSNDSHIYLWDYQMIKIIAEITIYQKQISQFEFINGYSCLIVGTTDGTIILVSINAIGKQYHLLQRFIIREVDATINHILNGILIKGKIGNLELECGKIYVGYKNGQISMIDILPILDSLQFEPPAKERMVYNPQRQLKENFTNQINKNKFYKLVIKQSSNKNISSVKISRVQAHQNPITDLILIQAKQKYLVSSCTDKRIKIWKIRHNFELICDLNINWPLPYLWKNLNFQCEQYKDKLIIAFKTIQQIFKRYGSQISIEQANGLKVDKFINKISKNQFMVTELNHQQDQSNIQFLQIQYCKEDVHYKKARKFDLGKIAGPTLRQFDYQKKSQNLQKEWKIKQKKDQEENLRLLEVIQEKAHKAQQKQQIINFLVEKPKKKSIHTYNPDDLVEKIQCIANKFSNNKIRKENLKTNTFNRLFGKRITITQNQSHTKMNKTSSNIKLTRQTFEQYYQNKNQKLQLISSRKVQQNTLKNSASQKGKQNKFIKILKDMDQRIKKSRKSRLRNTINQYIYTQKSQSYSRQFTDIN